VVRTVQAAFQEIDKDTARAGSTLGASPLPLFRTVWLPLAKAGVISGAVLAFARSLGETGATIVVAGGLMTVPVLTIFFKNSTPPDIDSAISLSALFVVLSAVLFLIMRRSSVMGRFRLGRIYADAEKRLSRYSSVGDLIGLAILFGLVLIPSFYFLKFTDFDFLNTKTLESIAISFGVAGAATAITVIFGLPLALLIASRRRGSGLLSLLVEMSLLMPTVTIGLSLALFWAGKLDEAIVLVLAHVAMIYAYFVSPVSEILMETDTNLIQVARSLGATPFYAFRTILLPLIWPTLIAGVVVTFMRSVSETGGTLAVSKTIATVPILIVNLAKADQIGPAASAAALLLVISLGLVAVLRKNQKKR
jgi:ABC-type sulfate transport system permease component